MRSLGRALVGAAGLMSLLAPGTAAASWWDGGYDGGYDARRGNNPPTTTTTAPRTEPGSERSEPGYEQREPGYGQPEPGPAPAPAPCDRPSPCGPGPVPPPPPPPPGFLSPVYGCENSDLPDTRVILHKTTTPPPGTPVRPGDAILVEITWQPFDWMGPELHKAVDCVSINGLLVPELSGGERPTPNDGHFAWHYFVPLDVPPGSEICDQGFVSGPNGWEEYGRAVSNVVCFPVAVPPPSPPCCATPAAAPAETTTTTVPEEQGSLIESIRFEQEAAPAPVLPEQRDVLPRTGGDSAPARLATAALAVAALAGGLSRARRR